jgi:hypothetical protein
MPLDEAPDRRQLWFCCHLQKAMRTLVFKIKFRSAPCPAQADTIAARVEGELPSVHDAQKVEQQGFVRIKRTQFYPGHNQCGSWRARLRAL